MILAAFGFIFIFSLWIEWFVKTGLMRDTPGNAIYPFVVWLILMAVFAHFKERRSRDENFWKKFRNK